MARKIAAADCETDPFEHGVIPAPFIWGYYSENEYIEFRSTGEFVNFIKNRNEIIYLHNGGKFDIHFLIDHVNKYENIMVINGRIAKAKIGECELRDSYCILPTPLSAFSKQEFEYWKLKKEHRKKYDREIRKYLESDCINLYNYVQSFISNYGMNLTIAGAAMKIWEKEYGAKDKNPKSLFDTFVRYYYGGRVECMRGGVFSGKIMVADINSAYPFAMVHGHASGGDFDIYKSIPNSFTREQIQRCFITIVCDSHGQFPCRDKQSLSFPRDGERRRFNVTGWEYIAALETGNIVNADIEEVYSAPRSVNFTPYVDRFFALKKHAKETGDRAQYIFAKLFLNSLYGKFAANPDNYSEFQLCELEDIEAYAEEGWEYSNQIGNSALVQTPLPEHKRHYYNVATAASITGFVRAYLWRSINNVQQPLYCDTDSIAFMGNHSLPISDSLGDWEIEARVDSAAIAGKKLYSFRLENGSFKTASKGAKLTPQEIYEIALGKTVEYKPEAPTFSIKKNAHFTCRNIKATA